jgi:hypothetical protein
LLAALAEGGSQETCEGDPRPTTGSGGTVLPIKRVSGRAAARAAATRVAAILELDLGDELAGAFFAGAFFAGAVLAAPTLRPPAAVRGLDRLVAFEVFVVLRAVLALVAFVAFVAFLALVALVAFVAFVAFLDLPAVVALAAVAFLPAARRPPERWADPAFAPRLAGVAFGARPAGVAPAPRFAGRGPAGTARSTSAARSLPEGRRRRPFSTCASSDANRFFATTSPVSTSTCHVASWARLRDL